jgi:hypothetical protein
MVVTVLGDDVVVDAWTRAGAASLCGRADGPPLRAPARLVPQLETVASTIAAVSGRLGRPVVLDAIAVLTERASILGLGRHGATSCGGASRLVQAIDGWVAVSLPRADDLELLPAWLGVAEPAGVADGLDAAAEAVASRPTDVVVSTAVELGLAVAGVGSANDVRPPVITTAMGDAPPVVSLEDIVVVDLTSLWAGPLCTRVLADAGATVIKVESTPRPDGARFGPQAFFDLMNAGKRSVGLDLSAADGRRTLRDLVAAADVVVEASRPRALAAMGLTPDEVLAGRTRLWVSLTGYGRTPPADRRIAFGDDAAAAGGVVLFDSAGPMFCGDALADPASGLSAAAAALTALADGGRSLVDVAMASVASTLAPRSGERAVAAPDPGPLPEPPSRGTAPELGADTVEVLAALVG